MSIEAPSSRLNSLKSRAKEKKAEIITAASMVTTVGLCAHAGFGFINNVNEVDQYYEDHGYSIASEQIAEYESLSETLALEGRLEELPREIDIPKVEQSYQTIQTLEDTAPKMQLKYYYELLAAFAIAGVGILNSTIDSVNKLKKSSASKQETPETLSTS